MTASLFRSEVFAARQGQFLGAIRIGHRFSFSLAAGASLVLSLALLAFMVGGEFTRKARLPGLLSPVAGSVQLSSPQAGVLAELRFTEGQVVPAGAVLFVVDSDRVTARGGSAALASEGILLRRATVASERALRETQARQRQASLLDRTRTLETELDRADAESSLMQRRVALSRNGAERFSELARNGFVADIQYQAKQDEVLDMMGRAEVLQRSRSALQRELQSLRAEHAAIATQLSADLEQFARSLSTLDQEALENEGRRRVMVVAPHRGRLSVVPVARGQTVQSGQTLATLLPVADDESTARLEAQLFAPSRATGFIAPGQTVWIRYAAFPYQKFGMHRGQIAAVSDTPIHPQDLPSGQQQALLAAAQTNEPLYRISVELESDHLLAYGKQQRLKPGMTLEADVVQDRRAIWEWLFEPLIALRRRAA